MKSGLKMLNPDCIIEDFDECDDDAKWDAIVEKMQNGWTGFPLLVVENQGDYYALNGSYRLAIAIEFVTEVPAYVIAEDDWRAAGMGEMAVVFLHTPENRLRFLQVLGDAYALEIYETDDEETRKCKTT